MEFRTSDTAFAAYLQVTQRLKFIRIEAVAPRAFVVFDDPTEIATQLEQDYMSGAVVPAADFHARLKALRKSIEIAKTQAVKLAHIRKAFAPAEGVNRG